ncbi:MAG: phage late control D family protein [Moraxellaceae bacterium]|nr:phage late control D family protein [Moraxellaceae bacterium]
MTHPRPIYRITLDGRDITPAFEPRLESLTLTDNRGFEADQLDLVLDDSDGKLAIPARGVTIAVQLGWAETGLIDKGTYVVDEVEHSGAPDKLSIRARSADLRAGLTTRKERSWHGKTLGDMVRSVAQQNKLKPVIAADLAKLVIAHVDQTGESDANLLTRVARDFDAIATVKTGCLLCSPIGKATTASGQPLERVTITRQSGDNHRFSVAERDTYTSVRANYQDTQSAQTGHVLIDAEAMERDGKTSTDPSAESVKVLRHVYASKANADRAARAEWRRLQRGAATFSITLAHGRPELFPDLPATVEGFKNEIDAATWLISRASHHLGDGGLTTSVELELL